MSEPFSWMDEGQGAEGGRRTDGGKKEGREGKRHSSWAQLLAAFPGTRTHAREHTPPGTQCSADRRLSGSGENPHSALRLPGHTQGQHYRGYTWG